jgi:cell division septation protein DedD
MDSAQTQGTVSSPEPKGTMAAPDLKTTEFGKETAEKPADASKSPAAEMATPAKEAAMPLATPMEVPQLKPNAALAPQQVDAPAAPPVPKTKASATPAPAPKTAALKAKDKSTTPSDLDKMAPFTIQVGAYRNKTNADEVISKLTKKGYAPFVFQVTDAQQRSFYMVRFGHFVTREEAAKALDKFKAKEKTAAVIVRSGMM